MRHPNIIWTFVCGLFLSSFVSVFLKSVPALSEPSSWSRVKTTRERAASSSSDLGDGTPPWQSVSGSGTIQEQKLYNDYPPTVFSSTGRLHAVERTAKATSAPFHPTSNLVVALTCKDGLVVISTVPTSPHLNSTLFLVNDTVVPILTQLSPSLAAATAGNVIDGQVMRNKLHQLADLALGTKGHDSVPPAFLGRQLADHLQVATQTTGGKGGRMLASSVVILGHRQLWRIDPTGQFLNCHAVAIGHGSEKAQVELYQCIVERLKENDNYEHFFANLGLEEAVDIAKKCIEKAVFPNIKEGQVSPTLMQSIPWYCLVMDYSHVTRSNLVPRRKVLRGKFAPLEAEST